MKVWPGSVQLLGHVDPDQRPKGKIACLDGHELVNSSVVYVAWRSSSAAPGARVITLIGRRAGTPDTHGRGAKHYRSRGCGGSGG